MTLHFSFKIHCHQKFYDQNLIANASFNWKNLSNSGLSYFIQGDFLRFNSNLLLSVEWTGNSRFLSWSMSNIWSVIYDSFSSQQSNSQMLRRSRKNILSLPLIKKVANNLQTKLFEILSLNRKTLDWIIILKNWFSDVDL